MSFPRCVFWLSRNHRHAASRTFLTMRHVLLVLLLVTVEVSAPGAEVDASIAAIEKLPRAQRLDAFESLVDKRGLKPAERVRVVQAFAAHAKNVSPAYGRALPRIDAKRWEKMLTFAYEQDAQHADTMIALCQLLIDHGKEKDALPIAQAYLKKFPDAHAAKAWTEWCEAEAAGKSLVPQDRELLSFPLHFCVLTRNPDAARIANRKLCEAEVKIFNDQFRTLDGRALVKFTFAGFSGFQAVRASNSPMLEFGDSQNTYDSGRITEAFNHCQEPVIRDRRAINVYIFDSYGRSQFADVTSHGTRNSNHPYLLIDWQRLGSNIQNAEPHEMGHAFGLEHVGVPGAKMDSSTNIMTSAAEKFGSGGKRDLGFTPAQSALVLHHARRTHARLGLAK